MMRYLQKMTCLGLLGGLMMAGGPAAAQESADVVASEQAYTTSSQVPAVGDPLANNTLQQGDLPVGATGTDETKRSYLLLDIPSAATAAKLSLMLSDSEGTNFGVPGPILACPVVEPFVVKSGDPIEGAPAVDCGTEPVVGEAEDDAYTFVLDPLLSRRVAGGATNGFALALVADTETPQQPYQITFQAGFFAPIGTYAVGSQDSDTGDFDPPPSPKGGFGAGSEDFEFEAPAPEFDFQSEAEPFAAPPELDAVVPPPAAAEEDEGPAPLAAGPAAPAAALGPFEPLPVNPAVWLLIPLGLTGFALTGRGLRAGAAPRSDLDRLLTQ